MGYRDVTKTIAWCFFFISGSLMEGYFSMIPSDYVWNLLFLTFFIPVYVVLLTLRLTELFVYSLHIIIICVAFLMLSNFNQIYIVCLLSYTTFLVISIGKSWCGSFMVCVLHELCDQSLMDQSLFIPYRANIYLWFFFFLPHFDKKYSPWHFHCHLKWSKKKI